METDSFIQAMHRFMARRGKVRSVRSVNGTNFVGTDNKLRKALEEMNQEQIKRLSPTEWNRFDYLVQKFTWCFTYW